MGWYLKVIKNYVGFNGRASRKEYWMFILFNTIIGFSLSILDLILGLASILSGLYYVAVILPSLAVGVRRLHDIGKSGWWLLVGIIPMVGAIILVILACFDSNNSNNKYGPNPKIDLTA